MSGIPVRNHGKKARRFVKEKPKQIRVNLH